MGEREKQVAFLKALIRSEQAEHEELSGRIARAEREERSVRTALWLVAFAGMLAVAGLGYSAVLLPQFFENQGHIIIKVFCVLGLGSGICLPGFGAVWLRHRLVVNRLYGEGRCFVLSAAESRRQERAGRQQQTVPREERWAMYQTETPVPRSDTELVRSHRTALSKAG